MILVKCNTNYKSKIHPPHFTNYKTELICARDRQNNQNNIKQLMLL